MCTELAKAVRTCLKQVLSRKYKKAIDKIIIRNKDGFRTLICYDRTKKDRRRQRKVLGLISRAFDRCEDIPFGERDII